MIIFLLTASISDIYKIGERLGQGSFGIVYEAVRKRDSLTCALKRIGLPAEEKRIAKLQKEANALYDLEHRHIVKIFMPTYKFKEGLEGLYL